MNLINLRDEIDKVDKELLKLFIRRMDLVTNIAEIKKENGLPILNKERETEIIRRISAETPKFNDEAAEFFQNIMDISKKIQAKLMSNDI